MVNMKFQSKQARDAKASELSAQGYRVSRRSSRNQVVSPNYVADADLTNATRNPFGGYDTQWFPVLYIVEAR
jgi:hypothetical protein